MTDKDKRLVDNICRELDRSLEDLDGITCSRLAQARNRALAQRRQISRGWLWLSPAAGLILLIMLLNWPLVTAQQKVPQFDVLGIMAADEPLDFYQQEIEFYEWLSEEWDTEKYLSDRTPLPAVSDVGGWGGTGGSGFVSRAECRTARISGYI